MARYAIGDVQGCYESLMTLLETISFDATKDELWFAGDLVNRGPKSLPVLRFIKELEQSNQAKVKVILGNHDLHLLACYYTQTAAKKKDTLSDVLNAPDCEDLMRWLVSQPLMVWDKQAGVAMTHAGLPPIWDAEKAFVLSQEVHQALQGQDLKTFFEHMYGNKPALWSDSLTGFTRLRVITNYFTRMRFIKPDGELDFKAKEGLDSAPSGFSPWFSFSPKDTTRIIFGHWAALSGQTGFGEQFQAIDTGCVWGGLLTALNIDTLARHSIKSKEVLTS